MSISVVKYKNYQCHFEGKALLLEVGDESTRELFAQYHMYGNVMKDQSFRLYTVSGFFH